MRKGKIQLENQSAGNFKLRLCYCVLFCFVDLFLMDKGLAL